MRTQDSPSTIWGGLQFGPSGFSYNEYGPGTLVIGGLVNGLSVVSGTDDYLFDIQNFNTNPTFGKYDITQANGSYYLDDGGTATVTQVVATPEPSTFLMLSTGLLGVGTAIRRKLA